MTEPPEEPVEYRATSFPEPLFVSEPTHGAVGAPWVRQSSGLHPRRIVAIGAAVAVLLAAVIIVIALVDGRDGSVESVPAVARATATTQSAVATNAAPLTTAPVYQPPPGTSVDPSPPETSVPEQVPDTTVVQPLPATSVHEPLPETSVYQPLPETSEYQPLPETSVYQPLPETSVNQPLPETATYQPPPPVTTTYRPPPAITTQRPSPVTTDRPPPSTTDAAGTTPESSQPATTPAPINQPPAAGPKSIRLTNVDFSAGTATLVWENFANSGAVTKVRCWQQDKLTHANGWASGGGYGRERPVSNLPATGSMDIDCGAPNPGRYFSIEMWNQDWSDQVTR